MLVMHLNRSNGILIDNGVALRLHSWSDAEAVIEVADSASGSATRVFVALGNEIELPFGVRLRLLTSTVDRIRVGIEYANHVAIERIGGPARSCHF
jgi:hypothetical protein